ASGSHERCASRQDQKRGAEYGADTGQRAGSPSPMIAAMRHDHILTLSCPDRTGIVYRTSGLLFEEGCNILDAQQFGDEETGRFFLRVHFDRAAAAEDAALRERLTTLGRDFQMDWHLHDAHRRARLLVLVSRQGHCLN